MLKEKTNRWFLALGAALLCAGLGAAALWDLEIDLALYSPGFLPAVLMEAFGWFPQYLPAVVLCVCIALDGARSMPLRAAGGLLAVAGSGILLYMGAHHLVKRGMSGPSITLWTVLLGGLSLGICALALYRSRSGGRKKLEFVCLWGTVYLLAGLAAINAWRLMHSVACRRLPFTAKTCRTSGSLTFRNPERFPKRKPTCRFQQM